MSRSAPAAPRPTIADWLEDLGGPAERVRRKPPPGTAIEKDVIHAWERECHRSSRPQKPGELSRKPPRSRGGT
jgi:hypothetical protein